jgi:hypothetical protein
VVTLKPGTDGPAPGCDEPPFSNSTTGRVDLEPSGSGRPLPGLARAGAGILPLTTALLAVYSTVAAPYSGGVTRGWRESLLLRR